ncbi:MAG: GntR family transcriptional regulator [Candidatus Thiodiazotropha lotti]|uniref:GntR family transcriptional regulator n=1 Tax=Candidatus Thiodiazotropha endoloripes TaxID=1818881 RepID=A0A1E2UNE7_9GAMM|nr:GntR family transcriptional regulator [Candidatus Thiodiazotropha endoloripes]MCG7900272.1 GntR family transcriptional regulator [Candidatus Thiodiazotropha weberae]MCG7993278.1 GntR family transcriptional regulator [Candidatus Thiodiazotropha lotti]MCG7903686.1 GntR family transcriptional regulator [Candidatus Thiodiazotropha weberae]MCG7915186.1 GntR family transcriptional regulator [Candidatus Thiodiazotropha weberae]MCG7998205.1 GntR family transcriptional regulator [Candidatus Thiodiaz
MQNQATATALDTANIPLTERLFDALQRAIVEGELPQGSKISEPELARQHGVSRGSLREAMARLEARKLVERKPNLGARVVTLSYEQLIEIFQLREALEGMAARLAAQNMSEKEIEELQSLLNQHGEQIAEQHGQAYFQKQGDLDFHYRIVQGSKNKQLIELLCNDLYHLLRMYRYQFGMRSKRSQQAYEEHQYLINAISARDPEMAELLMRQHIRSSRRNVEAVFLEKL